jgi:myosin heavy subunit
MNSQLSNTLQLTIPEDYTILNIGECTTIKSADDDVSEFNYLIKALTTLGFEALEVDALCTILAVILHLGIVQCYACEYESQTCIISSKSMSTSQISDLLGVNEDVFVSAILTHKMIIARRSVQVKILTSVDANNNIAALIKWIYGSIFKWIVLKINEANSHEGDISSLYKYIGILDIFGFETLNVNSFEQLCINFANERLQKLFNEEVFDLEQQYYATNGLIWTEIVYKGISYLIIVTLILILTL